MYPKIIYPKGTHAAENAVAVHNKEEEDAAMKAAKWEAPVPVAPVVATAKKAK